MLLVLFISTGLRLATLVLAEPLVLTTATGQGLRNLLSILYVLFKATAARRPLRRTNLFNLSNLTMLRECEKLVAVTEKASNGYAHWFLVLGPPDRKLMHN